MVTEIKNAESVASGPTCAYCDRVVNADTAWYGQLNRFESGFACSDCKPVTVIYDDDLGDY